MKKIIMFMVSALLSVTMFAQEGVSWQDVNGSVVFKGGYNVLEKKPVTMIDINADIGLCRVEFEMGYAFSESYEDLYMPIYFSPAVGVAYGYKSVFYFLIGAQPFITQKIAENVYPRCSLDAWHLKLEGGVDIRLSDLFFINLSTVYLVPRKETADTKDYQNLSFMAGLGIYF